MRQEQMSLFDGFSFADAFVRLQQSEDPNKPRGRGKKIEDLQYDFLADAMTHPDTPSKEMWSEEDIIGLREYVFIRTVQMLCFTCLNDDLAYECWKWVLDDREYPFSFEVCLTEMARQVGFGFDGWQSVDPDEVRAVIYQFANRMGNWSPNLDHLCA